VIAAIRNMHDRMLKAFRRRDPIECFKLEEQIHLSIAKACRNTILQRLHHTLNTRLYRARFSSTRAAPWGKEQWATTVSDLDAIIAALERHDATTLSRVGKSTPPSPGSKRSQRRRPYWPQCRSAQARELRFRNCCSLRGD
jgi:DNA-binding GntR family transcriptional regulator